MTGQDARTNFAVIRAVGQWPRQHQDEPRHRPLARVVASWLRGVSLPVLAIAVDLEMIARDLFLKRQFTFAKFTFANKHAFVRI